MTDRTLEISLRTNVAVDCEWLIGLCERWKIIKLELFGSVLRDDFHDRSDIDLLVTWQENHGWSLLDLVTMHDDFAALFERPVDLVSRKSIETSANHLRRAEILETARPLYPLL